jgi:predicted AlkP superfamily phosphohydrolase/phosphomutase
MTRIVMIGIDGLDADLLRVYGPSLPHLRRLMLESPFLELKSSFPPESTTAWASIYTGLNPANHGVLDWSSYAHVHSQKVLASASPKLKIPSGETFWDIAGRAGKRVCVVNPLLPYPALPVNGVMLSLPPVIPLLHQLKDFCDSLHTLTLQQVERGMELYQRESWDLFFLQLDALDHIQHYLWRYSDPGDPTYPGRNKHSGRILEFYRLFDTIIGRFRNLLEQDSVLMVVSGHGHGRHCLQYLNLNEWLRNQNWLAARMRSMRLLDRRYLVERAKHRSLELLTHLRLQDVMPHLPQYFPPRQAPGCIGHTACLIDQQETMAQVAKLAGTSPFGGILLNRACIERRGHVYEHVRKTLLQRLVQLRLKGRPVVNWAESRENVYQGKYIECYPDILFELRNEFGVSGSIYTPLTSNNLAHQAISGDHRMYGVVLLGNLPPEIQIPESSREPTVMDVAPTVLRLIEVASTNRDGEALVLPQAAPAMLPLT